MIYVGIVSHDEDLSRLLQRVLGETMGQLKKSMGCFSYENSYVFLHAWQRRKRPFDILFLNLSLLEEGTMEAAEEVKKQFPQTEIVFLAKTDRKAIQAFRLGATDYLLLPASLEDIKEAVSRCIHHIEGNWRQKILIKSGSSLQVIYLADLEAVVSDDHYQRLYLSDGRVLHTRIRLSEIGSMLEGHAPFHFLSPGRGILVNAERVKTIDPGQVILQSGRSLPISKRRYGEFKRAMDEVMDGQV